MPDCIFCKLVAKQIPAIIVFEDNDVISFMELHPSAPGHVMVILKKHGKTLFDYDDADLGKLIVGVKKVAKKVQVALNADALSIGVNHMEKRGVPHLHFHIIPRFEGDNGGIMQAIVHNLPKEDREAIAQKIRNVE
jgi:histidine triad (HIT) family protein